MPSSGNSIASARIRPLPVAVPRCNWKRSSAAIRSCRLSVGVCTTAAVPANDTMPILTFESRSWMKRCAADCAALIRSGSTSLACMLRETSIARISVVYSVGNVTVALGRAAATRAAIVASRNSAGGTWRRQRRPRAAARTSVRLA
jgi:hypothetical protein